MELVSKNNGCKTSTGHFIGQPVKQPRATADTTCGSVIEARPFRTFRRTTVSDHIPKQKLGPQSARALQAQHPMLVSQWSNPEQQPTQCDFANWKTNPEFPTSRRTSPATVEPGAVSAESSFPRKETCKELFRGKRLPYSSQTLLRPALHCHGPFQLGCLGRYRAITCFFGLYANSEIAVGGSAAVVLRGNRLQLLLINFHAEMPVGMVLLHVVPGGFG